MDPFVGEIRIFGGNFAPTGWALCNGQLMPITQNSALFSLLGIYYGGDGRSTFALPNLQGAIPMHQGSGPGLTSHSVGEYGGSPQVTLAVSEMPAHTHTVRAYADSGDRTSPVNAVFAEGLQGRVGERLYSTAAPDAFMGIDAVSPQGGSAPHNNMPPYLELTYIIALQGVFPARH
jgi:microcystin-dependent protein